MSQSLGLMADLDIGTEHLRWMGDTRFMVGLLRGGECILWSAPSWSCWSTVQSSNSEHVQFSCLTRLLKWTNTKWRSAPPCIGRTMSLYPLLARLPRLWKTIQPKVYRHSSSNRKTLRAGQHLMGLYCMFTPEKVLLLGGESVALLHDYLICPSIGIIWPFLFQYQTMV